MDLHKTRKLGDPKPSPAELLGRMVVVVPKVLTMEDPFDMSKGQPPKSVPTITADVVYFGEADGEIFEYGATEGKDNNPPRPAQYRISSPHTITDCVFSQEVLVKSFTPYVQNGGAVGMVTKTGGRAFLFESPPDGHPIWVRATEYFARVEAAQKLGQPVPQSPAIPINQPAAQPLVGWPAGATAAPAQPVYYAPAAPVATAPYVPPVAPAAPVVARPDGIPADVWAGMPPHVQAAVAAAQPAPAAIDLNVPVAGMEPAWPYLDPAARAKAYEDARAAQSRM